MGVSVSCGQDGTWLTFLERRGAKLHRVGAVDGQEAPCGHFGFSPDGERWGGCGDTWVRLWRLPACELLAEYEVPEERILSYTGVFTPEAVLVAAEDTKHEAPWELHQLDPRTLALQCVWELPLTQHDTAHLYVLPGGLLLSDKGAWRFSLDAGRVSDDS